MIGCTSHNQTNLDALTEVHLLAKLLSRKTYNYSYKKAKEVTKGYNYDGSEFVAPEPDYSDETEFNKVTTLPAGWSEA